MTRLTFLGTGTSQGVPVIGCDCEVCTSTDPRDNRLRTSAMIEHEGLTLVIDTGPDFRQQMLRAKPDKIDAVLFTHEHKDHIAGLDDIRAFNFKHRKAIDVYAAPRVQEALQREFQYVFADFRYPGIPEINLHDIPAESPLYVKGVEITPINVLHYKLPVLGFRVGKVAYITDANQIPECEMEKLKHLDILVLNALRKKAHISHFNLEQAVEISEVLKPRLTYFTHISHLMGLHVNVGKELPKGFHLAYDTLSVESA